MYLFFYISTVWAFSTAYEQLLQKYVDKRGCVAYTQWKTDPLHDQLKKDILYHQPSYDKAYWINLYNALTLTVVLEHYPIVSIREIDSGKVWSQHLFTLPQGRMTLDEIEHHKLRPLGDPRIHAALSCASKGCPPLSSKPYRTETIDDMLETAMEHWLDTNALQKRGQEYWLSEVFKWYADDFQPNPVAYIQKRRPDHRLAIPVSFFDYDWHLNERCER